jgi:hypothetical protein
MKPNSNKESSQEAIKRILRFVSDLLHSPQKGQAWMKEARREWKGRNAIEMIQSNKLDQVMLYIHARFF